MRLSEWLCIALFFFTVGVADAKGATLHPASPVRVVDGDNIWMTIQIYQQQFLTDNFRLNGIDTPEAGWRAKCEEEKALANTVKAYLEGVIAEGESFIVLVEDDDEKFGRPLATLFVDDININQQMIELGLAKAYGGEKKSSWCPVI